MKKYLVRITNTAAPEVEPDVKFNAASDVKAKSAARRMFRRIGAKTPVGEVKLTLFILNTTTGEETFVGLLEPVIGDREPKWTHQVNPK